MLIIFGGLPGTGKTTISKEVAKCLNSVYLRVDTIDPTQNDIRKGKFSLPDAIHLLDGFDIQII